MKQYTEEKEMFVINYGFIQDELEGTLEEAMETADEGSSYTQADITIMQDGETVARRNWWGYPLPEDDDITNDPINFGKSGYYGDWIIY